MPGLFARFNGAARRWQPLLLLGLGAGQIGCQALYVSGGPSDTASSKEFSTSVWALCDMGAEIAQI